MIKTAYGKTEYIVTTKYVINRGTKGHRTLHIYNNPGCYWSRQWFYEDEEANTVEEAMHTDPKPQMCKLCFPGQ